MEDKVIDFSFKKQIDTMQTKVKSTIEIENLSKILSVSAEAIISDFQVADSQLNLNGEICFVVVYIDTDNKTKSVQNIADFSAKIENDQINSFISPLLSAKVVDTVTTLTLENSVEIESLVEICLNAFVNQSLNVEINENCIVKNEPLMLFSVLKSGQGRLNIQEDYELKEKPLEILSVKSELILKNCQSGTGYIAIEAKLATTMIYTVDRENKTEMRSEMICRDINEEIEVDDMLKDYTCYLNANIKNCSIKNEIEDSKVKTQINADVNYVVFKKSEILIPTDAFCPDFELELAYDSLTKITDLKSCYATEKIEGSIEVDENDTRIARIICSDCYNLLVTSYYIKDSNIVVDGIAYESVICQLDDDGGQIVTKNAEIPFSVNLNVITDENEVLSISGNIIDVVNRLKKGRQIDIDMELGFNVSVIKQVPDAVVKDLKIGEKLKNNESNFMICFAKKGDTLWDVAKKMRQKEENILTQNKNLVFPLEKDSTIVFYKKVEK